MLSRLYAATIQQRWSITHF